MNKKYLQGYEDLTEPMKLEKENNMKQYQVKYVVQESKDGIIWDNVSFHKKELDALNKIIKLQNELLKEA